MNLDLKNKNAIVCGSTQGIGEASAIELAKLASAKGLAQVIGTTGFTPEQDSALAQASQSISLCKASNYSVGVNLCFQLLNSFCSLSAVSGACRLCFMNVLQD